MTYSDDELQHIFKRTGGYCFHCGTKLALGHYRFLDAPGAWKAVHENRLGNVSCAGIEEIVASCIMCNRSEETHRGRHFHRKPAVQRHSWAGKASSVAGRHYH